MSDSVRRSRRTVGKGKNVRPSVTLNEYRSRQAVLAVKESFDKERESYMSKINKLRGELRATQNMIKNSTTTAPSSEAKDTEAIKAALTSDMEAKIQQLMNHIHDLEAAVAKPVQVESQKSLHIGEACNFPEQPTVIKEGGAYKTPPLALSVNGAVAVHNIGYTSERKNLAPVHYDASSERLVVYIPNK